MFRRASKSSRRPCMMSCRMRPKWSASSPSSSTRGNTDGNEDRIGRNLRGSGEEGHQEHPPERLPSRREGAHLGAVADESRDDPSLRYFQTRLDQTTAEEAARAGTRNTA